MAVPTPASLNAALWSVLRDGPASPYARWFDVDWAAQERALLMPVLGRRIGEVRGRRRDRARPHEDPAARCCATSTTCSRCAPAPRTCRCRSCWTAQFYRLAHWRVGDEELNYRRFFDIDTLAGVRVEDAQVFAETHAVLLALVAEGRIDGLRIDHPDGLADPRGYVQRLFGATGGAGSSSRRSSRATSSCPPTGRAPARRATTPCCASAGCSSTRPAPTPLDRPATPA